MQETGNKNKISIQVGLDGYLYRYDGARSAWLGAARIFSTDEFLRRYDEVELSVFSPKFTLVPKNFFSPEYARELLSDVAVIPDSDPVNYVEIPERAAVAVFSTNVGENLSRVISEFVLQTDGSKARVMPELYYLLKYSQEIPEYNKVIASYADGRLYLVIEQGRTLLLCNSYPAVDFTTAEYYLFSALHSFQLNAEVSTVYFRTPLEPEQEMSLYNYFKSVETI